MVPEDPPDPGRQLPALARAAIAQALGLPAAAPVADATWLQQPGASFVTLSQQGQLRGCIGSLQAWRALRTDVQANAVAAALHDTRFAPLRASELARTAIEVSVLSEPQALEFDNEAQALAQLRPGIDGLILSFGERRSTFLPQVWAQLPSAAAFLAALKRKAGLAPDFWAPGLRLQRYTVRHWQDREPPA